MTTMTPFLPHNDPTELQTLYDTIKHSINNTPPHTSQRTTHRKKQPQDDKRWSNRYVWPNEHHRDFISAVFDTGLRYSTAEEVSKYIPHAKYSTLEHQIEAYQKVRTYMKQFRNVEMQSMENPLMMLQLTPDEETSWMGEAVQQIMNIAKCLKQQLEMRRYERKTQNISNKPKTQQQQHCNHPPQKENSNGLLEPQPNEEEHQHPQQEEQHATLPIPNPYSTPERQWNPPPIKELDQHQQVNMALQFIEQYQHYHQEQLEQTNTSSQQDAIQLPLTFDESTKEDIAYITQLKSPQHPQKIQE